MFRTPEPAEVTVSEFQVSKAPTGSLLLEAALDYAKRGWHVFPLHTPLGGLMHCSCGTAECSSIGKHPRTENGLNDATTDPTVIRRWWSQWPHANIGIAAGSVSGIATLDVDPRHRGDETLARLVEEHGELPDTVEAATGGGGSHLYFLCTGELRGRNGFCPGLDFKADGGHVVAPPSLHASGEVYSWAWHPDEMEIASLPEWLLKLVRKRGKARLVVVQDSGDGSIAEGTRNDYLCSVAGTLRRRDASPEAIEAALLAENKAKCSPPLDTDEVRKIARGILRYEPEALATDDGSRFRLTDSGNAKRFAQRFRDEFRFCHPWKKGLIWDGRRWKVDDSGAALCMTREIMPEIEREASRETDDGARKARQQWAKKSGMVERRRAMVTLAAVEPGIPVLHTDLDRHPLLLNVENGTLDLETLCLRDHDRMDLLTQAIQVPYDPKASCPRFERFLERVLPDVEPRSFVQRALGYSLSGLVGEQVLFFAYGDGANGKSTLLGLFQSLLGHEYSLEAAPDLLLSKRDSNHPTELAALLGKRFVVCQESGESRSLDETRVKRLTGGDPITARRMREDFWTFWPTHKLWLVSNYQPRIHGTDEGIWRRVLVIPFEEFIPEDERDPDLPEKLREELPGILAWSVRGWADYRQDGLQPPKSVGLATQRYREEQDVLGRFLLERVETVSDARLAARALFAAYKAWCEVNGEKAISATLLGRLLVQRGFEKVKSGTIIYLGHRLKVEA